MAGQGIAVVLPPREGFSETASGAVGLCVRDFALNSEFQGEITVYGGACPTPFSPIAYRAMDALKPWYRSASGHYLHQLKKEFAASPPALIEVHNRPRLALALAAIAPTALHLHNDPQAMKDAASLSARRLLLRRCREIWCVSRYIAARFLEGIDDPAEQVKVLPNGFSIEAGAALPKERLILYAGRLAETKGALPFAQALAHALPELDGWRGVVIGADRHRPDAAPTPYEKAVAAHLAPLERDGLAEWHGYLPHRATMAWFARAAIVVVPSLWEEPFGRTALEAMAHGCALITSGRGGLAEVAGEAAMIVPPNAETLAEAILALARNPAEQARLATLGRRQAELFSISAATKRLDARRRALIGAL